MFGKYFHTIKYFKTVQLDKVPLERVSTVFINLAMKLVFFFLFSFI